MKLLTQRTKQRIIAALFFILCAVPLSMPLPSAFAAKKQAAPITLSIPQSLIAETMRKILPTRLNTNVSSLKGNISLVDVRNLRIFDGGLSARLRIAGQNMAIKTNIGGHNLNMNVGSLELDVTSDATLRFDAAKQILYVRPTIKEAKSSSNGEANQIGNGLAALLNGREFPIALQKLQPIVSQAGAKEIIIRTRIAAVKPRNGRLDLALLPTVSTRRAQ